LTPILKPTLASTDASMPTNAQTKQGLYNSYASMLLGYLAEALKDKQVAEQYLVDIFNELQFAQIQAITKPGVNTYCQLQMIARKKLAQYLAAVSDCADDAKKPLGVVISSNKFVDMMSPEQQIVFCSVHYHGKTTTGLSAELNKPEAEIKRILKESFTIIRNQRNDTATVHR
jgi:DNA-directed RNA polymerase specialized sigma24 family protein